MPRKPEYLRDASMIPGGQSILIPGLKNFSGLRWGGTTTNRGQRSISVRLTKEQADYFVAEGCNVNVRPPKEPGDQESYALKIIINYKPKGDPLEFLNPTIDVGTDTTPPKRFDEDMLDLLDGGGDGSSVDIYYCEIVFSKSKEPVLNRFTGKEFYPCYLQSGIFLYKTNFHQQRLNEINAMYAAGQMGAVPPVMEELEPF